MVESSRAGLRRGLGVQMALSSFTVMNYRSFIRPTTIELKPLTLIFGHNNSGKSALLRALPLLAESAQATDNEDLVLASQGAAAHGGAFRDLVPRLKGTPGYIEFVLAWDDGAPGSARLRFRQVDLPSGRPRVVLEEIASADSGGPGESRAPGAGVDLLWSDEDQPPHGPALYRAFIIAERVRAFPPSTTRSRQADAYGQPPATPLS